MCIKDQINDLLLFLSTSRAIRRNTFQWNLQVSVSVTKELKEVSAHHHSDENGDSCYSVWTEESSESFVETSFNDVRRSIVGRRLSVVETFI
jgi:hypothetical protein